MMDIYPSAASKGEHKFSGRSAGPLVEGTGEDPLVEDTGGDTHTAPSSSRNEPLTGDSGPHVDSGSITIDLTSNINPDDMLIDVESAEGASSTLISSVTSGKRKAVLDVEDNTDSRSSDMPPPSSSAHAASAASVASSGISDKRKKIKLKKETPAAASMRSSRQSSSSRKTPAVSDSVQRQQVISRFDRLVDKMEKEPEADPLTIKQSQAIELLEADQIAFDLTNEDFATVAMAFSTKLGFLTTYLSIKHSSARHAFLRKIIEQGL